jgi:hypothetical protein
MNDREHVVKIEKEKKRDGSAFSADIFRAQVSVEKLQRFKKIITAVRSLNMIFDVRDRLLLLNQNH